jgi:hypothetical protein
MESAQDKSSRSWYYEQSGQRAGPVSDSGIQSLVVKGTLSASTLVWRRGWTDWKAVEATELNDFIPRQEAMPAPASVPDGVKAWCWGGFLLNWIWAIRFRVWWGLLAVIPVVGWGIVIWLGVRGRETAWRNGQWPSVAAFNRIQRRWSIAGVVLLLAGTAVLGIGYAQQHHVFESSAKTQEASTRVNADPASKKSAPADQSTGPTLSRSPASEQPSERSPAPVVSRGSVSVDDSSFPKRVDTVGGTLEMSSLPDNSSAVFLRNNPLFSGSDAEWQKLVHKFRRSDGTDIVLMRSSGGRGTSCETLYFFLLMDKSGMRYTPEFGSCNSEASYEQHADTITITIPRMGGITTYQLVGDSVTEDGKPVPMLDSQDPSK